MCKVIRSLNALTIGFLAMLPMLFFHQSVSADAPTASEKAEQFRQLIDDGLYKKTLSYKHSCSSSDECLAIGLLSLLFNFSDEPLSGLIKVSVYNPEGKRTILGTTVFGPLEPGDGTPIIFNPKPIKDSGRHGSYTTVIDIYSSDTIDTPIGLSFFGEVIAYDGMNPFGTAVNFIDVDFIAPTPNFQINVPYFWHK